MADVRCPTCGLPNPAEAEKCQFCGENLKPLGASIRPGDEPVKRDTSEFERTSTTGSAPPIRPGDMPTKKDTGELERALPAWLRDVRGGKEQIPVGTPPVSSPDKNPPSTSKPSTPPPAAPGTIDWLAGLSASQEEDEEVPDWLTSIGGKAKKEEKPVPSKPQAPAAPAEEEWLAQMGLKTPEAKPPATPATPAPAAPAEDDWLSQMGLRDTEAKPAPAPEPEPAEPATGLPDWFSSLRSEPEAAAPIEAAPEPESALAPEPVSEPDSGLADWLAGLDKRTAAPAPAEPASTEPDWMARLKEETPATPAAGSEAQDAGMPDWLSGLSQPSAPEAAPAPQAEPAREMPDWLSGLSQPSAPEAAPAPQAEPAVELPDWLNKLQPASEASAAPAPESDLGWLKNLEAPSAQPESAAPAQESNLDWLKNLETPSAQPESAAPAPQAEPAGEMPDWLNKLQPVSEASAVPASEPNLDWLNELPASPEQPESAPAASAETPSWLGDLQAPAAPAEGAVSETRPDEMPAWLKGMQPPVEKRAEEPPKKAKPFKTGSLPAAISSEVPAWLANLQAESAVPASEPSAEEAPPPAWVSGGKEPATLQQPAGQVEPPSAVEQPDWLSNLRPDRAGSAMVPAEAASESELPESLEKGELPSWVQAMRPVADVVADANVIAAQSDQPAEESGPLAGLRGVLPVGTGIGLTRKPPAYSIKLQVGENQQRHADRLERSIISESEAGALSAPSLITSTRVLRWVVALVLILAVGLTLVSNVDLGMAGAVYPPEMVATMNLVGGLKPNAPVLVVFDYQPAFSGELEAAAAPVVDHLLFSGARLTFISTNPTGPALAERFLRNTQGQHNYQPDQQYVNLGYLAGGPAGVLDFTTEPAVAAPFTVTGKDAWSLVPLQGIQKLGDFSLVLILTDDADVGRVWIEQAGTELGETPMAMVISAQAEPMIRPYYDSGQIKGLITGLAGGRAYEQALQRPGLGAKYWNAFGVAMLAAEIMIAVGAAWTFISALRGRRNVKEGEA